MGKSVKFAVHSLVIDDKVLDCPMSYRIEDIDVPVDSPFANDVLDRKPVVEFLSGLIGRLEGPFVLAIDSPWGTGKTTLVRMLVAELQRTNFQCVHFNAWKVDYVTDPLVALVSSVDRVSLGDGSAAAAFNENIGKAKRIAGIIAKRALIAGAKAATLGALDADKEMEAAAAELSGNAAGDLFDAFESERKLLEKFRDDLAAAISQLSVAGKHANLVFFIDELDRCRPTFAIELLERIKHLFDVPNLIFVLSIDKQQLEAIACAVYGQGIDAPEYLRRFIDLEMGIPNANAQRFTEQLITRFGLTPIFAQRNGRETSYDKSHFVEFFSGISDALELSLRARERCITRLRVVLDQTPSNHYLDPILVALLVVLRAKEPDMFRKVVDGRAAPSETIAFLVERAPSDKLLTERHLTLLEAYLSVADPNRDRSSARRDELQRLMADEGVDATTRNRAGRLIDMMQSIGGGMRMGVNMAAIAAKVDLAALVRD